MRKKRKLTSKVALLAKGKSFFVAGKKPEQLNNHYRDAKVAGFKITAKQVDGGTRITRL